MGHENYDELDEPARIKLQREFDKSPEYQAYVRANENHRNFGVKMNDDGTFRAEDVPAGDYTFNVQVTEPRANSSPFGRPLGRAYQHFTVPEMQAGRSDDPLDLGVVELQGLNQLKVGDAIPDLPATTLDGKPLSLGDYKGKYLIVHFWNVVYRPKPDDLPDLKAAHAAIAKDQRIVMLSVSLDQRIEWPRRFAAKNGLRWPQAHLGESHMETLSRDWSAQSDPIYIFGPDGKLLARDIKPAALKSTIEKLVPPQP